MNLESGLRMHLHEIIQPFHTNRDGDIMLAVSAGDAPRSMNVEAIGEFASRLAASAVRSAVAD